MNDDDDTQDYVRPCPQCEYHKNRAARWRAEAYKQAGHEIELPWVGLTEEQAENAIDEVGGFAFGLNDGNVSNGTVVLYAKAIEAALRKKNS